MRYMSRVARWERKLGRTGQLAAGAGPESRSGLPHCGRHSAGARNDHDDDVSNHDDDHDDDDVRAIDDDHFDIHHGFNPMTVTELMVNRCDVNLVPEASRRPDSPPVGSDLGSAARSPAERFRSGLLGPCHVTLPPCRASRSAIRVWLFLLPRPRRVGITHDPLTPASPDPPYRLRRQAACRHRSLTRELR